jgi:hypothetical protein
MGIPPVGMSSDASSIPWQTKQPEPCADSCLGSSGHSRGGLPNHGIPDHFDCRLNRVHHLHTAEQQSGTVKGNPC